MRDRSQVHRTDFADVESFPLTTEVRWDPSGWIVELAVIVEPTKGGYRSLPVSSYSEPYRMVDGAADASPAEADRVRTAALVVFAERLRQVWDGAQIAPSGGTP